MRLPSLATIVSIALVHGAAAATVSMQDAVRIATDYLRAEHLITRKLSVTTERHRGPDESVCFPMRAKLRDRDYWLVHFFPPEPNILDGGSLVYVDRKSGEVIGWVWREVGVI